MNINKNLKYNNANMARLFSNGLASKMHYNNIECKYENNKWTVRNNLGVFENWGQILTVSDLSTATHYKGKLVVLSTNGHEYQWVDNQWVDKGSVNISSITADADSYWKFSYMAKTTSSYEIKFKKAEAVTSLKGIFGAGYSALRGENVFITTASKFRFAYVSSNKTTTIDFTPNAEYVINLSNNGTLTVKANGEVYTDSTTPGTTIVSTAYCYIGTGYTTSQALAGEIEYFKVWEGDTLIRHFLPGADLNMYDIVNGDVATLTGTASLPSGSTPPAVYDSEPKNFTFYQAADSFSVINANYHYNVDANNEIVSEIANATKPYAYNKSDNKWYVKNDSNNYEQYGIMPTVLTLEGVTTYTGKLVLLSTDSHEYKWNGSEWVDLGGYVSVVSNLKGLTTSSYWVTDYKWTANTAAEIKFNKDTARTSWTTIFGARVQADTGSNNGTINVYINTDNTLWGTYNGLSSGTVNSWAINNEYTIKFGKGQYYVNGTLKYTYSSAAFSPINYPIWIGGLNQGGSQADNALQGKIYYMKIWENDTLVRNYEPQENLTFVDSIGGHIATLVGSALAESTQVIPEQYPEKPAPSPYLTKTSYHNLLIDNYLNGQIICVYGNAYEVKNGKMEPYQETYFDDKPLGFKVYDGNVTLSFVKPTIFVPTVTLYYAYDAPANWQTWDLTLTLTINSGHILYIYGPNTNIFSFYDIPEEASHFQFSGNGRIDLVGNILSLISGLDNWTTPSDEVHSRYRMASLFMNLSNIYNANKAIFRISALRSSATYSVIFSCFFRNCQNLATGPQFLTPITYNGNIANFIYMFEDDINLVSAEVPYLNDDHSSRTLERYFYNCSSLKNITYRGSVRLNYTDFSYGLPATGTFHNINNAQYATGVNGIPSGWTVVNN